MSKTTTFEHLHLSKPVLSALAKAGYTQPTPIQEIAIPLAIAGKDIIAKAPTGTGKTAVFVLAALERLLKAKDRVQPRVLILTPTRELATQVTDVVYKLGKELRVNATSIVGGMPYREQLRKLSRPNDVIIATPGRCIDYLKRGSLDFSHIEMLVLDEADRMLDMGFIDDVKLIADATPKNRQTLLFTATLDGRLVKLAGNMLKSPEHVEVEHQKENLDNITQRVYIADDAAHKTRLLKHLLTSENVYKAIVFSATKRNADELARQLRAQDYAATAIHGDIRQHKRNTTITRFKEGQIQLLIATDVAARGIDVHDISHVFIYDLSKFAEDHVHRVGRTGRAGKKGIAISFVGPSEASHLQKIERMMKKSIPHHVIEGLEPRRSLRAGPNKNSRKPSKSGKPFKKFSKEPGQNSERRDTRFKGSTFKDKPFEGHKRFSKEPGQNSERRHTKSKESAFKGKPTEGHKRFSKKPSYHTKKRDS